MKNIILGLGAILLAFAFSACSSPQPGNKTTTEESAGKADPTVYEVANPTSLADILARLPGVYVEENIRGTTVTLRGRLPLFVVDGMPVGNSYQSAAQAVNVFDIASVEVLRTPSETVSYGSRGQNGVIVIRTR